MSNSESSTHIKDPNGHQEKAEISDERESFELQVHKVDLEREECERPAPGSKEIKNGKIWPKNIKKDPSSSKSQGRLVSKDGQSNISLTNIASKQRHYILDVFTTAVDMQWRYMFLIFFASFLLSWLAFAVVYYIISTYRRDFEPEHLPSGEGQVNGTWKPCIWAVEDFTSCFLFSLETQHTIGYGGRQITERCPEAIIIVLIQSVIGVIISACMAGLVFAKLTRPKRRTNTLKFSENAVITMRNGFMYLLFRVGNIRRSLLIDTHVAAQFVHHERTTLEGETLLYDMEELQVNTQTFFGGGELGSYGENGDEGLHDEPTKENTLMLWPVTISHRIDRSSPFYDLGPDELQMAKFELIVSIGGANDINGSTVQARSSYLPSEILWGHRFNNLVSYAKESRSYLIDFSHLNNVKSDNTPRMSVREIEKLPTLRNRSAQQEVSSTKKTNTISRSTYQGTSLDSKTASVQSSPTSGFHSTSIIVDAETTVEVEGMKDNHVKDERTLL